MKVQLTKANAFEILPGKRYVVLIKSDVLTHEQKLQIKDVLTKNNMDTVFLPKDVKYTVTETPNERA